ncbi:MAG: restriction endonuclease subunit S, partial [Campylobacter sp.]|nr:restriction endonuclease subunit S [Campylobacter sp.]
IPWIGQIPKHWEISKIKYHGTARNGLTYSPSDLTDESGILVLRSSNVQDSKLVFNDNVYVSCSVKNNLMVKNNDILICSRNGSRNLIGKNALIDRDVKATFGAFMLIYRSKISKFMFYVLNSNIFSYHLSNFVTSTINQLTNSNFENIKFPLPPLNEQKEIAEFLDKKCEKIDRLNENYTKQIATLKEYKKSLIYECVTGKKKI